jgi:hypothetical protein
MARTDQLAQSTNGQTYSPHLTSPHLTSPHLTSPHLTSPHLTSPHLTSPHLTSPHLTLAHFKLYVTLLLKNIKKSKTFCKLNMNPKKGEASADNKPTYFH